MERCASEFIATDMSRIVTHIAVLLTLCCATSACNTWAGLGKDLQHLGKSIEDRAKQSPATEQ